MYPEYSQADPKKRLDLLEDGTYLALSVGGVPGDAVDMTRITRKTETNTSLKVDLEERKLVYENEAYSRGDSTAIPDTVSMDTLGAALRLNDLSDISSPYPNVGDLLQWNGSAWASITPEVNTVVSYLGLDTDGQLVKTDSLGGGGGGGSIPVGGGYLFAGPENQIPAGFVPQDGRALSRSVYSVLFGVIGTSYGAGDGSTTFNIPNTKGRTIVGLNASDSDFNARGKTAGSKTHTLTVNEMPSHSHSDAGHAHSTPQLDNPGPGTYGLQVGGGAPRRLVTNTNTGYANIQPNGGNQAHNNVQPSLVEYYVIRII